MTYQAPESSDTDPQVELALRREFAAFVGGVEQVPSLSAVLEHGRRRRGRRVAVAAVAAAAAVAVGGPVLGLDTLVQGPTVVPASQSTSDVPVFVPGDRVLDQPDLVASVDRQIRQARGVVDDQKLARAAFEIMKGIAPVLPTGAVDPRHVSPTGAADPRLVWGGHTRDGRQVLVATARHHDGTEQAWLFEANQASAVSYTAQPVPPGPRQLVALAFRGSYVILGPAQATRFEIQADGHTLRGTLDEGGAVVDADGAPVVGARVSMFDQHGRLVDEGVVTLGHGHF